MHVTFKFDSKVNVGYCDISRIMVLIMGGYSMSWADAKAWALRHWPDIDIYDEGMLPHIVENHQINLGRRMTCIPFRPDESKNELIFFVVIYSKRDPLSTPYKYRVFHEGKLAMRSKELIFSHEGDKELAEKSQFMTIADPWKEWPHYPRKPFVPAPFHTSDGDDTDDSESESK